MIIAVDFDGTCVTHDFPHVGKDIGAVPVLKELVEAGNQLILWTMRDEKYLAAALRWCSENEIRLYSYQRNPTQDRWTRSPKCYAELYIDDAALGCPLKIDPKLSDRPFVDWEQVREELVNIGAL
jgi:hypothetical protein